MTCFQALKANSEELTVAALSADLEDGQAHYMGDGLVVILQRDPTAKRREIQSVVLCRQDLEAMQDTPGATLKIALEDGEAHHMGDGLFVVSQLDDTQAGSPMQRIVLTANDTAAMLKAA